MIPEDDDYENPVGEVLDPETAAWLKSFYPKSVVASLVGVTMGAASALVNRVFSGDDSGSVDT